MPSPKTLAIADFFKARPNQWIDGVVLASVGGRLASRTRISECRTILGMDVRNRCRKVNGYIVSEYAYVPEGSIPQAVVEVDKPKTPANQQELPFAA